MPSVLSETNPADTPPAAFRRLHQLAMPSSLTVVLVSLLLATPTFIFWLWLVIVPARVALLCPEECKCDIGGNLVFCYSPSLTAVPLIPFTYVRVLWLVEYNVTLLKKKSFVSLTELEILHLSNCGLRTIELGAFNGLTELTELDIHENKLSEIELGAFNGLTKLTELKMRSNEISEIIPGTFENMNCLESLNLKDNRLQHLDSNSFSGLFKLKNIYLSGNKLQYLHPDTFLWLPNIQSVFVDGNMGLQIPTDRNFINSLSLSYLKISRCNVSSLSVETFANVSALKVIDLSDNNLRTLNINTLRALPKLSAMYLYGNPLQCECQLQEVWRWCEDSNIRTAFRGRVPGCDTPSEVKGMRWGVLERGECLGGNIQYFGDYNSTSYSLYDSEANDYEKGSIDGFRKQYLVPAYAFPFIFGTTGNVILLIIIICNKDMRTVPNMYIVNLAVSDIINLTVLFSEAFANRIYFTWSIGDFMGMFLLFCRRLSVGLSAYSVAVYSYQRYRVTVHPFQVLVSSQATWCVTVATICGVWIVAALFAVPSALSQYPSEDLPASGSIIYYRLVVIFELLVSCVLPLCVVAFSYIMTARHLVKSSRCISEETQNPQLHTRRNTANTVVGLALVFLISYVPYHAFWTYFIYSAEDLGLVDIDIVLDNSNYKLQYTYIISACSILLNSCLNPVALFSTSSQFRRHLKRYLTCFCKTNFPPTDFELTRRN